MQRYFITAEATYEDLRQSLNSQLSYPNDAAKTVFQTALQAPRDSFRRVLLAVDTALATYPIITAAITPLLDSDAMEEIDEATYLAAVASASSGGGGSQFDVRSDVVSSTAYTGRAVAGSATSASVWTIRRSVYTSAGAVSSTATATNVKWDDRLTASYS